MKERIMKKTMKKTMKRTKRLRKTKKGGCGCNSVKKPLINL